MKRHGYTAPEFTFGLLGILFLVATLFSQYFIRGEVVLPTANCQSNLKQVGLGVRMYVQDYDEKYPLARSGNEGWVDIVVPYVKSVRLFQCPQERSGDKEGTTDYFYNARLSRVNQYDLKYMTRIVMLGDSQSNGPSHFSITQLPKGWTQSTSSPSLRHLNTENNAYAVDDEHKDGANYAYADGHVKWLRPENITTKTPAEGIATFAVK